MDVQAARAAVAAARSSWGERGEVVFESGRSWLAQTSYAVCAELVELE